MKFIELHNAMDGGRFTLAVQKIVCVYNNDEQRTIVEADNSLVFTVTESYEQITELLQ